MAGKGSRMSRRAKLTPSSKATLAATLSSEQKWWKAVNRLTQVQLGCSLMMQLSYVAFPAYNFSLAIWCFLACTPSWSAHFTRLVPLHMLAMSFSVVADIIWMSLWVSGRVFFDQFCNANGASIVSCGGASDHFPGCRTNQFALFTLIMNLIAKVVTIGCMQRIHSITLSNKTKHHVAATNGDDDAPNTTASAQVKPLPESIAHEK